MKTLISFCILLLALILRTTTFRFSDAASRINPSSDMDSFDEGAPVIFDVTKYGAIPDGKTECNKSFIAAWDAACGHPGNSAILYIPQGSYLLGPVLFAGPCSNNRSPAVKIDGNLVAPGRLDAFPEQKWIEFSGLNGINVTGNLKYMNIDGQGAIEAWRQTSCKKSVACDVLISSIVLYDVSHGSISNITLSNSKGFHLVVDKSDNITVENIAIRSPGDSPNTDGIHVGDSTNIKILSSTINVGDDCVSIGPGSFSITIGHVTCGPGHGISIGSLGRYPNEDDVKGITVHDCTISDTTNGVRVKSFPSSPPSSASNITFQDIIMTNVFNPIIIDQQYCPSNLCDLSKPSKVQISDVQFINIRGTTPSEVGVNIQCSKAFPCQEVKLSNITLDYIGDKPYFTSNCSNAKIIYSGPQTPPPCYK